MAFDLALPAFRQNEMAFDFKGIDLKSPPQAEPNGL